MKTACPGLFLLLAVGCGGSTPSAADQQAAIIAQKKKILAQRSATIYQITPERPSYQPRVNSPQE